MFVLPIHLWNWVNHYCQREMVKISFSDFCQNVETFPISRKYEFNSFVHYVMYFNGNMVFWAIQEIIFNCSVVESLVFKNNLFKSRTYLVESRFALNTQPWFDGNSRSVVTIKNVRKTYMWQRSFSRTGFVKVLFHDLTPSTF